MGSVVSSSCTHRDAKGYRVVCLLCAFSVHHLETLEPFSISEMYVICVAMLLLLSHKLQHPMLLLG